MTAQPQHARPGRRPAPSSGATPDGAPVGPGPVRTCVGCRGRDIKALLVRVAVAGGGLDVDVRARRPGRGAYVHLRPDCVERALDKGNLGRALRTRVDRAHTTALRQSLFALLAPSSPGNLPPSGESAQSAIQSSNPAADLSTCSPASTQRTPSTSPPERMSRPNSENPSMNPAPVGSDRANIELTRPAPPFVDEHHRSCPRARGQR
jgi:predicted RNA-binding protein YlxR (DUF448 family)